MIVALLALAGCHTTYDPARATAPYPRELAHLAIADMQVFREADRLEIVNSTARSYRDVTVWVNRRYAHDLDKLIAGDSVTLSLWDFFDVRGEAFNAGGVLRTTEPQPVRLVELELPDHAGLVGLITIRAERAEEKNTAR